MAVPFDGFDPSIRTPVISNTFDARDYQGQPYNYFGDNIVPVVAPATRARHVGPS